MTASAFDEGQAATKVIGKRRTLRYSVAVAAIILLIAFIGFVLGAFDVAGVTTAA